MSRRLPLLGAALLVLAGAVAAGPAPAAAWGPAPWPVVAGGGTAAPVTIPVPPALTWTSCQGGFQCARLSVPLDYAVPRLGRVSLRLLRLRASGPGTRLGSLLVNPGGPGVSAVDFLRDFARSDTTSLLRPRFDLVAFDPRGTGGSAPLRCLDTAQLDRFFHVDPDPDTPAEIQALDLQSRALAAGCRRLSARILPHLSTTDAARDMESVRLAVHDRKLTYLGYSYGTALGAAYLDEFPLHVRAMVLDGALDPRSSWDQLAVGQARGFELALNSFLAWCGRTPDFCAFRRVVRGDLGAAYDAIAARLERRSVAGSGSRLVGPAELYFGAGEALYTDASWPELGAALADLRHGDGRSMLQLSDYYLERTATGYSNSLEANYAVNCVDRPFPRDNASYQRLADRVRRVAPRLGAAIAWGSQGCARWPVPATSRPHAVTGFGSPPIVVIGTTRDPATPYAWAIGLARQLSRGVLLTFDGDGHTAFGRSNACIDGPVNAYLLTTRAPTARTC